MSPLCFGVFGHPIGHSRSPRMHNAAFEALGLPHRYLPFDVSVDRLGAALAGVAALGFGGVNLTVPLKQAALQHVPTLSEAARRIGAINTVIVREHGLQGDNTDGIGFMTGLRELDPRPSSRAVVLGAGGAALAVVDALLHAQPPVSVQWVSRRPGEIPSWPGVRARSYDEVNEALDGADTLVDTTTVGMKGGPLEHPVPIDVQRMVTGARVVDLVYPRSGTLLDRAEAAGARVQDGLPMLLWQGVHALERWLGLDSLPDEAVVAMRRALMEG